MRLAQIFTLTVAIVGSAAATAHAGNYILYVQGRGWQSWNDETVSASGWTNVFLAFNGNNKLDGAATNTTVRNAIQTYCSNGNSCVIHCYSAGCLRVLKAVSDLRASGHTLPGFLWAEGSASAAGGTRLAEIATKGLTGFLAKLFGQQEKIDFDLTRSAARNTWGYVQDDLGKIMYHAAGKKNICKKILFFKICGNKYVDAGVADGLVGMDSAAGASAAGKFNDGCAVAKYPYREYDAGTPCGGVNRDHFGMPGFTAQRISAAIGGSAIDKNRYWGDSTSADDCDDASGACDNAFEDSGADFSNTPSGASVAIDVSAYSSQTTGATAAGSCYGKCGKFGGNSCWCDAACTSFGDCCGDYAAAGCFELNGGGHCAGNCGSYVSAGSCWCDTACTTYGDCCTGYTGDCG